MGFFEVFGIVIVGIILTIIGALILLVLVALAVGGIQFLIAMPKEHPEEFSVIAWMILIVGAALIISGAVASISALGRAVAIIFGVSMIWQGAIMLGRRKWW